MNKRYTEGTAAQVCRKLMNHARLHPEIARYSWTDAAGNQCFCDGFRAYRLRDPLPNMPTLPEETKRISLDPTFKPLDAGNVIEIPAPDPDAVKTFVNESRPMHKGKRSYTNVPAYDLGEAMPDLNPLYMLDVLRLFPGAAWYVLPDPAARLCAPVFIVHDAGTACILPVRNKKKMDAAKPQEPTPAPADNAAETVQRPAPAKIRRPKPEPAPPRNTEPKYFIYARMQGDKKYYLANLAEGTYKVKAVYAPMYPESRLEEIKERLDACAAEDPTASFQIRRTDGKRVIYTAVPTFTPELFAERVELTAMTPEEFAAAYAA